MISTPVRILVATGALLLGLIPETGFTRESLVTLDESALLRFQEFRNLDGSSNNVAHPEWGSTLAPLMRHLAAPAYEDNVGMPPSAGLPSPRQVSNDVVASPGARANGRGASNFIWQWGQFIDHDVSRTFPGHPDEPMPIAVPQWDPHFDPFGTGTATIPFSRSLHSMVSGVRQQLNEITAYIDASQVYGSGGFDLAALNIQRGRDHGLPRYNDMRVQMGLAAKTSFVDVCTDPLVQSRLALTYSDVDDIDLWVGGLCEDHVPGAMVGELLHAILTDQFTRLRDGDRFWYENHFSESMVAELEQTTLAQIIRRNCSIGNEISNHVFEMPLAAVAEHNGPRDEALVLGNRSTARVVIGSVFPNPARHEAGLSVSLEETDSRTSSTDPRSALVVVYDVRGRLIRTLHDGTLPTPTTHLRWDLRDAAGQRVVNGLYFLRVEADGHRSTRKVLLTN